MSISVDELNTDIRDPHNINDHVMTIYEDVFGEPHGIKSPEWIWKASFWCFRCGKNSSYNVLSFFFSCIMGCIWGCQLGVLTFCNIWCFTPCLRLFAINCGCIQKYWGTTITCCLSPVCESCGLCFSRINVEYNDNKYTDHIPQLHTHASTVSKIKLSNKIIPARVSVSQLSHIEGD